MALLFTVLQFSPVGLEYRYGVYSAALNTHGATTVHLKERLLPFFSSDVGFLFKKNEKNVQK